MRPRGKSLGLQQGIALRIRDVEVTALAAVCQANPFVGVHLPLVVGQPGPFGQWLPGQSRQPRRHRIAGAFGIACRLKAPVEEIAL